MVVAQPISSLSSGHQVVSIRSRPVPVSFEASALGGAKHTAQQASSLNLFSFTSPFFPSWNLPERSRKGSATQRLCRSLATPGSMLLLGDVQAIEARRSCTPIGAQSPVRCSMM
ncbi:hypothetical protein CH63R_02549 [Colletotrichum higginsianum IMI 349063]|uniref:Uncharacterized protein n=1 Tax=Colletotrichum higginsianum (strain IMI 349063) TaxID=759273 RepID=A0A1B7YP80_COLHI|nr:hypothetical protein CH63R_02549 [Colletotrichum higginsianum IMI 349063]OBR13823.1 hypothetical protein CH63R_02549 [Colletotrichum higginsianum IMI 349063]